MKSQDVASRIRDRMAEMADGIVERQFLGNPELTARYGPQGRARCLQDASFHLQYLASAVETERPILFVDYMQWVRGVLDARRIPSADLVDSLHSIREVVCERLPAEDDGVLIERIVSDAIGGLDSSQEKGPGTFDPATSAGQIAQKYLQLVLEGRRSEAADTVVNAVESGLSVKQAYLEVFQPVQYEIGRLWQTNAITVAQEHFCSAVTQMTMSRLYPKIFSGEKNGRRLVAACVSGDLHEIGLRAVADVFEIEGWDTFYVGANTPANAIVDAVIQQKADMLALSATMTYHVGPLRSVVSALRSSPVSDRVRVLVGGRLFQVDPTLVEWVGADGSAGNADQAVRLAEDLLM